MSPKSALRSGDSGGKTAEGRKVRFANPQGADKLVGRGGLRKRQSRGTAATPSAAIGNTHTKENSASNQQPPATSPQTATVEVLAEFHDSGDWLLGWWWVWLVLAVALAILATLSKEVCPLRCSTPFFVV